MYNFIVSAAFLYTFALLEQTSFCIGCEVTGMSLYGDSVSADGSTFALTNGAWPVYPVYDKKFSNGKVWFEYVAAELKLKNKAISNGAFGGSTTNNSVILGYTGPSSTWPVMGAAQQWGTEILKAQSNNAVKSNIKKHLQIVCAGGNDYYFGLASILGEITSGSVTTEEIESIKGTIKQLVSQTVNSTLALLNDIIVKGSPNQVAVCDLYPLQLAPSISSYGDFVAGIMKTMVVEPHNALLQEGVDFLKHQYNETNLFILPMTQSVTIGARTFKNQTTGCVDDNLNVCTDPDEYAFYDSFHPSTKLHKIISQFMVNKIRNETDLN